MLQKSDPEIRHQVDSVEERGSGGGILTMSVISVMPSKRTCITEKKETPWYSSPSSKMPSARSLDRRYSVPASTAIARECPRRDCRAREQSR